MSVMAAMTRLKISVLKVNMTPMRTMMPTMAVIMRVFIGWLSFVLPEGTPLLRVPHNPGNGRVFRSLRRAQDILGVVAALQPAKTAAAVIELLNGGVQVGT